jgi:hypothetical protein
MPALILLFAKQSGTPNAAPDGLPGPKYLTVS